MKNKRIVPLIFTTVLMFVLIVTLSVCVFAANDEVSDAVPIEEAPGAEDTAAADDGSDGNVTSYKALAAAIAVGLVGAAGAIGMGIAIGKSAEGIARQPEASGKINSTMMLGLVFIETAIIYALVVAILVIFVL